VGTIIALRAAVAWVEISATNASRNIICFSAVDFMDYLDLKIPLSHALRGKEEAAKTKTENQNSEN
jgi:hypothetical protein